MHYPLNGAIECDCWFQIFLLFHPADGMMILNDFKCPLTLANPPSPCLASEVLGSGLPADRLLAGRVGWWRGHTWMHAHMGLRQVQMEDIAIGNKQQNLCSDCQVWGGSAEVLLESSEFRPAGRLKSYWHQDNQDLQP